MLRNFTFIKHNGNARGFFEKKKKKPANVSTNVESCIWFTTCLWYVIKTSCSVLEDDIDARTADFTDNLRYFRLSSFNVVYIIIIIFLYADHCVEIKIIN